jgi:hypothetical protein
MITIKHTHILTLLTALLLVPLAALHATEKAPLAATTAMPAWQRTNGRLAATVASYKGRNVIVVNGKPMAPLLYSGTEHSRETWTGRPRQSIEDFVYRRNRHVGGRGHGVKFNGTRAWIADNHFENLNGNAVLAGYTSEVSGHGARDVVVSGNTIVRCGWTPIEARSTSRTGGNIIIRNNRITETREAAIGISGCDSVLITSNDFTSSTPPRQSAWITAEKTENLRVSGNKHAPDVPEIKTKPQP